MTQLDRANVVMRTVLTVGALLTMCTGLWAALNHAAQAAQKVEIEKLNGVDRTIMAHEAKTDERIDKLIGVVEINSALFTEPAGSPEYRAAVFKLRAMRRVVQN